MTDTDIILTGEQIPAARLLMLRRALKFEVETGMKMWRGVSIVAVLQNDGITTARSKRKAFADIDALVVALGIGEAVTLKP